MSGGGGDDVEVACMEGVGRLVSVSLRGCEEFKRSASFSAFLQALLLRITEGEAGDFGQFTDTLVCFVCN